MHHLMRYITVPIIEHTNIIVVKIVVPFWMLTFVWKVFPIFDNIIAFDVTVPIMNCCKAVTLPVSADLYIFSTIFCFNGAKSLIPVIIANFARLIGFLVVVASLVTLLVVDRSDTTFGTQEPFLAMNQQLALIFFSNIVSTNVW